MSAVTSLPAQVRARLDFDVGRLSELCRTHGIARLEIFGSALRADFDADRSDLDFLYTMRPDAKASLFDLVRIEDEFAHFFGRRVDLVSRSAVEQSPNPYRRAPILRDAATIYEE